MSLELKSRKTADEIEAEAREWSGLVEIQLPYTRAGWQLAQQAEDFSCQGCVVVSADGASFIADINDADPAKCLIIVELR
jgi:hypothetical protein